MNITSARAFLHLPEHPELGDYTVRVWSCPLYGIHKAALCERTRALITVSGQTEDEARARLRDTVARMRRVLSLP